MSHRLNLLKNEIDFYRDDLETSSRCNFLLFRLRLI